MPFLRAQVIGMGQKNGKDTVEIVVRAASKTGAILTARAAAIRTIPLRDQRLANVSNNDNERVLDKWVVEISDFNNTKGI